MFFTERKPKMVATFLFFCLIILTGSVIMWFCKKLKQNKDNQPSADEWRRENLRRAGGEYLSGYPVKTGARIGASEKQRSRLTDYFSGLD